MAGCARISGCGAQPRHTIPRSDVLSENPVGSNSEMSSPSGFL